MIQKGSYIKVSDNSGIEFVKCIKIFGTSNPRYGYLGTLILINVSNKDVLKGYSNSNIKFGLIINVCKFQKRFNGEFIRFDLNSCLVINRNYSFAYTRVYVPMVYETKKYGISNLSLYAEAII